MELLSLSLSDKALVLSGSEDGLYLHTMQNQWFGRPLLLCSGYKSGLSACISGDSVYYTYINKDNALLFRRLYDPAVLFRLDSSDSVLYHSPQLILFHHILFLFYWETAQDMCRLKLCLPFSDLTPVLPEALSASYSGFPQLHIQTTEHYLYLMLSLETSSLVYRCTEPSSFAPLCTEAELLPVLQLPWEAEKKQLEHNLTQAIRLSGQQQTLLTETEQKLQTAEARLAECEQSRQQTAQSLAHTSLLLERAKSQYTELMQVAEQYRQEAMKWYGKFTDRN